MILILMLDIIFLLFILDGYWTIILGHEWEVPLGGRNPIPPQYLGFYLLAFTFLEIPFIFLQHPHSPLHPLQSIYFLATSSSSFTFLAICGCKGKYVLAEWTMAKKSGVATWIKSRNHIGPFGPFTYIHRSTYQIIGPEFGYDLGRC